MRTDANTYANTKTINPKTNPPKKHFTQRSKNFMHLEEMKKQI
jgi:hypothetical protein